MLSVPLVWKQCSKKIFFYKDHTSRLKHEADCYLLLENSYLNKGVS